MGRRSSIDRLDPAIRAEVDDAFKRGATIDEIVSKVRELGTDVSRSAVGGYTKQYKSLAGRTREITAVSRAFASEFNDSDDMRATLPIQLLHSLITRVVLPMAADDKISVDPRELHFIARAVKDAASAAKSDVERLAKVREEGRKEGVDQSAKAAETAGRRAGADAKTIETIKREILGLKAE